MHIIDWLIVGALFVALAAIAYRTQQHMRGVADFLAANRCAGRYLLTLADGMAGLGAIAIIAAFQQNYQAGFGAVWWGGIMAPIMLLLPLTGFIIYRFRESRVMTIAEFFERRYSRRFRIFTGILAWIAGVINYGVFPSVTARFLIHFCGIPEYTISLGPLTLNMTLGLVMFIMLGTALLITFRGGQIAIVVTDFIQAQYVNIVFLIVLGALLWRFGLSSFVESLKQAPEGHSMLNPFEQGSVPDFNLFFFLIAAFNVVYTYMAWQGNQAYNCSAKSPHEAKMARILAAWRFGATWTIIALIPLFAYAIHHDPSHAAEAARATTAIQSLDDPGLQRQLTVPLILREMLPVGIFGLFVAAMLAAAISTDDTYLHSWGSIFIQDVLLPFRNKPLAPEEHMKWLRRSILGVAVFVWCFGMLFPLHEYIFMYWAITGAIYVGGAGSVIIGGFYWKRATTSGAWAGMIVGSTLATVGVVTNNIIWPYLVPYLKQRYSNTPWIQGLPPEFWFDGMQLYFFASLAAIAAYVGVSLVTKPNPGFDMDKLLHRGPYAIEGEHAVVGERKKGFLALLGVDHEYTRFDTFVAIAVFVWTLGWFVIFIGGTIYALAVDTTDSQWATYWIISQGVYVIVGVISVVWFLWGGFRDLRAMFVALRQVHRDVTDDGFAGAQPDRYIDTRPDVTEGAGVARGANPTENQTPNRT